jgi:shikimate kinase
MGCGKSSVANALGTLTGLPVLDLDQEVERMTGRTIPEIFASDGEAAFRKVERSALESALAGESAIIATGGGAPCQDGVMELLSNWGNVVFLDAPFELLSRRVTQQGGRPKWRDDAKELFTTRLPIYRQAKFTVDASQPLTDVASAILEGLQ